MNIFQQYNKSLVNYFSSNYFYAILGIVCGLTIDKIITHAKNFIKDYKYSTFYLVFLQLFLMFMVFAVVEFGISKWFAESWQSITPGFVFVSMIFGTSYNLYSNIQLLI